MVTGTSLGFALENQSRPVYPYCRWRAGRTSLLVHELAHQWFGDACRCACGATSGSTRASRRTPSGSTPRTHGGSTVGAKLHAEYAAYSAGSSFWDDQGVRPGSRPDLLVVRSTRRGAMTLAALGNRIGAADLTDILQDLDHAST